jgi:hypothetical protein
MQDDPKNNSVNRVCLDHQVVVEKIRGPRRVGEDAANGRSGQKHRVDLLLRQPRVHVRLPQQIELAPVCRQDLAVFPLEPAHNRRAGHAAMTGNPDAPSRQIETIHDGCS